MHTQLIADIAGDSWYWSEVYGIVIRVNNDAEEVQVFNLLKENTERNALRMICHRLLGATEYVE